MTRPRWARSFRGRAFRQRGAWSPRRLSFRVRSRRAWSRNFYGIANNIKIDFASPSLLNKDRLIDRVSRELEAGLIDIEDAIRTIYPDLDEEALQDKIEKAKVVQHEKQQSQFNEMNFDGTFGNEQYEEPKDVEGTTYPTN